MRIDRLGRGQGAGRQHGANQALTAMINEEFAPLLVGEDPRDITRLWETLYNGSRAHYALGKDASFRCWAGAASRSRH